MLLSDKGGAAMRKAIKQCHGKHGGLSWCLRPATVERDGKYYCWQHDPVRRRAKAIARNLEIMERYRKLEEKFDAEIKRKQLMNCAGITSITNEQLEAIAKAGGIARLLDLASGKDALQ